MPQVVGVICECMLRLHCRGDDVAGYDSAAGSHQSEFNAGRMAQGGGAWLDTSLAAIRRVAKVQCQ